MLCNNKFIYHKCHVCALHGIYPMSIELAAENVVISSNIDRQASSLIAHKYDYFSINNCFITQQSVNCCSGIYMPKVVSPLLPAYCFHRFFFSTANSSPFHIYFFPHHCRGKDCNCISLLHTVVGCAGVWSSPIKCEIWASIIISMQII